jgi:hypothetical protein
MTKEIFWIMIIFLLSCAKIDVCIKREGLSKKPENILIGYFEKRTLQFDPFIEKNFREALRFDLFKLGYKTELLAIPVRRDGKDALKAFPLGSQRISEFNHRHSSGLFIEGVISERSYGDAMESEMSTLVLLFLYNGDGIRIGEVRYIGSDTLARAETILKISSTLAGRLHGVLSK